MKDRINEYPNRLDTRVALLECSLSNINDTLGRIEKKFDKIDNQFDEVRSEFKEIRKEMKSDVRWVIGMIVALSTFMIGGFSGLLAVMAHGFHWF